MDQHRDYGGYFSSKSSLPAVLYTADAVETGVAEEELSHRGHGEKINMKNPTIPAKEYLGKLINNFVFLKVTIKELKILNQYGKTKEEIDTLNISHTFFKRVIDAFWLYIIVELNKLLSGKEEITLYKWLKHVQNDIPSLNLTEEVYGLEGYPKIVNMDPQKYLDNIEKHIKVLVGLKKEIKKIKNLRDKLTHSDPDYFSNPEKVFEKYPIDLSKIIEIEKKIEDIFAYHHIIIKKSSLDFEIKTHGHVDNILRCAEAFLKFRKDPKVIEAGIKPVDYLRSRDNESK
ncbi:hypothetical protein KKF86_07935 [bacterium]|nr:hypothetical protein [bacterium]